MSSISITPVALPARRPLRLTRRGRAVFATLAAAPLVAVLVLASVNAPASAGNEPGSASFDGVTVAPGESLWSIAERIAPEADPREVVGELKSLNGLEDSAVLAGQTLAIPAQYAG